MHGITQVSNEYRAVISVVTSDCLVYILHTYSNVSSFCKLNHNHSSYSSLSHVILTLSVASLTHATRHTLVLLQACNLEVAVQNICFIRSAGYHELIARSEA